MFIDTHTHLFSDSFNEDRDDAVKRAMNAGVQKMLLPNIDVASIEKTFALHSDFPKNCLPMMGLHPGSVDENWKESLEQIRIALFEHPLSKTCVAVGEIGMDLYWDKTLLDEQKEAFRIQIDWAKELNLPIVIHARDAFSEIFEILDEVNNYSLRGVFHCFTGNLDQAKQILSYEGFMLGIGGVVTYKKSELPEVLKQIDLKHIILETDSPYLPPTPFRGKRNESAYLLHVAEKLADIYQLPLSQIEAQTTQNAEHLFKI